MTENMEYSIRVREVYTGGNILGYASVVFDGCFQVNNIAIMLNSRTGEWFVSMPSYASNSTDRNGNTVYKDICNPVTAEFRARLYEDILIAFNYEAQKATPDQGKETEEMIRTESNPPSFSVTVTPLEHSESSVRALVKIVLDDCFAVNNVKLCEGKDGMFLSMPSVKTGKTDENGKPVYRDICFATTRQFRNDLRSAVMKEYRSAMKTQETRNMDSEKMVNSERKYGQVVHVRRR